MSKADDIVVAYNNELWSKFLGFAVERINCIPCTKNERKRELKQALEVTRAIASYRAYRTPEELFEVYPDLLAQEHSVELLWAHFDSLSVEELSDLMIGEIHEILEG